MPTHALPCQPPADSAIQALLPGAFFADAWQVAAAEPALSALGQFLKAARATPAWVNRLMHLRNRAVALVGLKDLGTLAGVSPLRAEADYQPGDRVGIFTLFSRSAHEVLLGDQDRHLDVTLSVHCSAAVPGGPVLVTLSTVVHLNNLLGRLYMLPVAPMHRRIAPAVLDTLARPLPLAGSVA